jgi:hypothetical protein
MKQVFMDMLLFCNGGRNFFEIPTRSIEDRTRKDSGLECKWSIHAMDWPSVTGHIESLQWWKES